MSAQNVFIVLTDYKGLHGKKLLFNVNNIVLVFEEGGHTFVKLSIPATSDIKVRETVEDVIAKLSAITTVHD